MSAAPKRQRVKSGTITTSRRHTATTPRAHWCDIFRIRISHALVQRQTHMVRTEVLRLGQIALLVLPFKVRLQVHGQFVHLAAQADVVLLAHDLLQFRTIDLIIQHRNVLVVVAHAPLGQQQGTDPGLP